MHDFVRQVDVGRRAFARDHEMNYPIPSFLGTCESREVSGACRPVRYILAPARRR
jgi:hypothetical protein